MKDSLALALHWAKDLMKDWVDNDPAVCLLLGQGNSRHQPWALPAGGWQVDTGSNVAVIPVDDICQNLNLLKAARVLTAALVRLHVF